LERGADTGESSVGVKLQPLSIGGLLDEAFRLYRRHVLAFVLVISVVDVPLAIIQLGLAVANGDPSATSGLGSLYAWIVERRPMPEDRDSGPLDWIVTAISFILGILVSGATTLVASQAILGRPVSVRDAYRRAFSQLRSLVWADVLFFLAVGLLSITCLGIPFAIYRGLGWSLTHQTIVLEGHRATDAMRRSADLVGGFRWRLFAVFLVVGLLVTALAATPELIFGLLVGFWNDMNPTGQIPEPVVLAGETLVTTIGHVLFGALSFIVSTLLYYDLRVRKEAFDLEQRLGVATTPPTEPPAR
jgi:hypothetical protein